MIDDVLTSLIARVRPTAANRHMDVPPRVLFGWYLRKGLAPAVRGGLRAPYLGTVEQPFFLGRGTRIIYGSRISAGKACSIGGLSFVNAFSVNGIQLGDRVTIREGAWIQCSSSPAEPGLGLSVGSNTYIGPQVILGVGGAIRIGRDVQFGAGCTLISENHEIASDGQVSSDRVIRKGITIGDGCWLGHRSTVLDGVTLGENCVVGAGAVVTHSFPAGARIAGVPARLLP